MNLLIVAALIWIGVHVGIAGTRLRDRVVARIGDGPFRGLFSLLSIVVIMFLVRAWSTSPTEPLWLVPELAALDPGAAMLPAFVLFVASVSQAEPDDDRPAGAMARPPRGMTRVTRHPMLWSFAIWAAVHVDRQRRQRVDRVLRCVPGDGAGRHAVDRCQVGTARNPATWQALSAATSVVPFAAIVAGRNRFVLREIGMGDVG